MKDSSLKPCRSRLLCLLWGFLFLVGCGQSQTVRYYQLSPLAPAASEPGPKTAKAPVIGLGPLLLPEYLNRPQLVTRSSPNRLVLADGHRWAEPLADNVMRVFANNLSRLLGGGRLLPYPWPRGSQIDLQLAVRILEFEGGADGSARLEALWSVSTQDGRVLIPEKRSALRVSVSGPDHEALVAGLSEALGGLSREIVTGLRPLIEW